MLGAEPHEVQQLLVGRSPRGGRQLTVAAPCCPACFVGAHWPRPSPPPRALATGRSKGSAEQQALKSKLAEMRTQFQQLLVRACAAGCTRAPASPVLRWAIGPAASAFGCSAALSLLLPPRRLPCLPRARTHAPPAPARRPLRPARPQSQKQQLRSQLDMASKARESARSSMKELRSTVKFTKGAARSSGSGSGRGHMWLLASRLGSSGPCLLADPCGVFVPSGRPRPRLPLRSCVPLVQPPLRCSGGH